MKLNLGCGTDIKEGWVNADKYPISKKVVKCNLEKKFPWRNNAFDEVYIRHALEHSKDSEFSLEEIHRVCKNNAKVTIIVPHCSLPGAMADLNHFQAFNYYTLNKLAENSHRQYQYNFHYKIEDIKFSKMVFRFMKNFFNKHPHFTEKYLANWFPIEEITYIIRVQK